MNIVDTKLSRRVKNVLRQNNILTVEQLLELNEETIYKFRNLGTKSINEIKKFRLNFHDDDIPQFNLVSVFRSFSNQILHEIISNYFGENYSLYFVSGGQLEEEIDLKNVSRRVNKRVIENGLNKIEILGNKSYHDICHLEGLGEKSIEEIIQKLISRIIIKCEGKYYGDFDTVFAFKYTNDAKEIISKEKLESLFTVVKEYSKSQDLINKYDWKSLNQNFTMIIKKQNIHNLLRYKKLNIEEEIVLNILRKKKRPMTVPAIKIYVPDVYKELNFIHILNELRFKKRVTLNEKGFQYKPLSVYEFIEENFSNRTQKVLILRLEGKTLEDIGNKMNFTRERARQIISQNKKALPSTLLEERYKDYFIEYDFSKSEFLTIFKVQDYEYEYLCLKYKKGEKSIEEILEDENASEELKLKIESIVFKDYIVINDDKIKLSITNLIKYITKRNHEHVIHIDDFIEVYNEFLQEHEIDQEKYRLNNRYLEGRVAEFEFTISLPGKKFRYYKLDDYDWVNFYEEIDLERYNNLEISTAKIFKDNINTMLVHNINNEYELHNIMRKTYKYSPLKINFIRNPTIVVGEGDRDDQVINLFLTHVPIEARELAELYEEEFGFKTNTALANHFECIKQHLHNGRYYYENIQVNESDKLLLDEVLNGKSFHFIEDIKKRLLDLNVTKNKIQKMITPMFLHEISYKPFTSYILSYEYETFSDYVRKTIFNKDIVNLEVYDSRYLNLSMFESIIRKFNENLEYIEFEKNKFISIEKLKENGLTESLLREKTHEVYSMFKNELFSLSMVREYLENTRLGEYDFSDRFYISLMRSHSNIYTLRLGGTYILSNNSSNLKLSTLIEDYLMEIKSIDIFDLQYYLEESYGLVLDVYRIREATYDTELYYNEIMEKIYLDNEYYYEEFD